MFRVTVAMMALVVTVGCVTARPPTPAVDVPCVGVAPVVDGRLDESVWESAGTISGLTPCLGEHYQEKIDRVPTTMRLLWSPEYLYVGFECLDSDIYCTGTLKQDDDLYKEDVCEIFLDGKGDGRQYVEIQVSPTGENLDLMYLLTDKPQYTPQGRFTPAFGATDRFGFREWDLDGLQTAAVRADLDEGPGWSVEMAIPAAPVVKRQGRKTFAPGPIRANLMRYDWPLDPETGKRTLLHMNWSPVLHGCPHISPTRMGTLNLLPGAGVGPNFKP